MRDLPVLPWLLAGALGAASGEALAQETPPVILETEKEADPAPAGKPVPGRLAVSAKYGSTGPAADLTYGWTRDLHGRLSLSYQPHLDRGEGEGEDDQVRASASLLLDWHPGGGGFRLSGGLAYLRTEFFEASATSPSYANNELTPYVGIGWGNPLASGSRWRFVVDLGAFVGGGIRYSTSPESGRASTAAARQANSDDVRVSVKWHAVLSTGISFRF